MHISVCIYTGKTFLSSSIWKQQRSSGNNLSHLIFGVDFTVSIPTGAIPIWPKPIHIGIAIQHRKITGSFQWNGVPGFFGGKRISQSRLKDHFWIFQRSFTPRDRPSFWDISIPLSITLSLTHTHSLV